MKLQEYIDFYEEKLFIVERKKEENLEVDKSTNYIDKKIEHYEDLITILKNCKRTEQISEENSVYKHFIFKISNYLQKIEIAKLNNSTLEVEQKTAELMELLKEITEEGEWK